MITGNACTSWMESELDSVRDSDDSIHSLKFYTIFLKLLFDIIF